MATEFFSILAYDELQINQYCLWGKQVPYPFRSGIEEHVPSSRVRSKYPFHPYQLPLSVIFTTRSCKQFENPKNAQQQNVN